MPRIFSVPSSYLAKMSEPAGGDTTERNEATAGFHKDNYYEAKLKMLILIRARKEFGPEIRELRFFRSGACGFEDLIFSNVDNEKRLMKSCIVKYKSKNITVKNIIGKRNGYFHLPRLLNYHRKIKQNKHFKNDNYPITLYTNTDLDEKIKGSFCEITDDTILSHTNHPKSKFYKLRKGSEIHKELSIIVGNDSEIKKLAKKLAHIVLTNENIVPRDELLKYYSRWLLDKVFRIEYDNKNMYVEFTYEFLSSEGDTAQSKFRNAIIEELQSEQISVECLKTTKLKIYKNFTDVNDLLSPIVTTEEIDNFINDLVFAVNQPSIRELDNMITQEIVGSMGSNSTDFETSRTLEYVYDWVNLRREESLALSDGDVLVQNLKRNLTYFTLMGTTAGYKSKLNSGYSFRDNNKVVNEIKMFLDDHKYQILALYHESPVLSALKVLQATEGTCRYNEDIYCDLKSLNQLAGTVSCPVEAFRSELCIRLVIDIDSIYIFEHAKEFVTEILKILKVNSMKHIIFLIPQDNAEIFEKTLKVIIDEIDLGNHKYCSVHDNFNKLSDISHSKSKPLDECEVIFQGKAVILKSLIHDNLALINGEILGKIILNEKIEIGETLIDEKITTNRFINRVFERRIIIREDIHFFKNYFNTIIDSQTLNESDFKSNKDIIVISDKEGEFKVICEQYKYINIHWFKNYLLVEEKEENPLKILVWQRSQGSVSKLRKYLHGESYSFKEILTSSDKVVIIAGEPGSGKSTLVRDITTLEDASLDTPWIIKINLLSHLNYLSDTETKKVDKEEALKFICSSIKMELVKKDNEAKIYEFKSIDTKRSNNNKTEQLQRFEEQLFNYCYNHDKVFVLLDGLDEVYPDFRNVALNLIEMLQKTAVHKIFVTTRPYNILDELENRLGTFAYTITPLELSQQLDIFKETCKKVLGMKVKDELYDEIFNQFLKLFTKTPTLDIPLHITLLVSTFEGKLKGLAIDSDKEVCFNLWYDSDLVNLCKTIINTKMDFAYKSARGESIILCKLKKQLRKECRENHWYLALVDIFTDEDIEKLFSKEDINRVQSLMKPIEDGEEKAGIVDRIVEDKPHFINSIFAEYFVADFFNNKMMSENIQFKKFLYNVLTTKHKKDDGIFKFFNYLTVASCDKSETLTSVLDGDLHLLEKITNINDIHDCYGRTALHLACYKNNLDLVWHILERHMRNGDNIIKDKLFNWTPLHYAAVYHKHEMSDTHDDKHIIQENPFGRPPLYYAVVCSDSQPPSAKVEGLKKCLDAQDMDGKTPIMLALQNNCNCLFEILLYNNPDLNVKDSKDRTVLHYALDKTYLASFRRTSSKKTQYCLFMIKRAECIIECFYSDERKNDKSVMETMQSEQEKFDHCIKRFVKDIYGIHIASSKCSITDQNTDREIMINVLRTVDKVTDCVLDVINIANDDNDTMNIKYTVFKSLLLHGAYYDVVNTEDIQIRVHRLLEQIKKLIICIEDNDLRRIKSMLNRCNDKNVIVNSMSEVEGRTPLDYAILGNCKEIVQYLLSQGAYKYSMEHCNTEVDLELFHAVLEGNIEKVEHSVIKYEAEINCIIFGNNMQLLHISIMNGHTNLTDYLITKDAFVLSRCWENNTIMHIAVSLKHFDIVELLIKRLRLDQLFELITAKDIRGNTPIHMAIKNNDKEIGELLFKVLKKATKVLIKERKPSFSESDHD